MCVCVCVCVCARVHICVRAGARTHILLKYPRAVCVQAGEKHHLLGGREPVSAKEVEGAVDFAVQKLNAMSNNLNRMVNLSVTDITRQVRTDVVEIIEGVIFHLLLSLTSASKCVFDVTFVTEQVSY